MPQTKPIKVGVVGKGGVGKTTVSALLAQAYSRRGGRVVAIDTDSNPNLGLSLGLSLDETETIPVLPRAVLVGNSGSATAEDLLGDYGRPTPGGPLLLSAIRVTEAGAGCTCSGHATVRSLLSDALDDIDVALVDMEAGLEHLTRSGGTLAAADLLLVVCEPTRKSVVTAARTATLAAELGIPHVLTVGNKARSPSDADYLRSALMAEGLPVAGVLPYDDEVAARDRDGTSSVESVSRDIADIVDKIIETVHGVLAGSPTVD